MPDLTTANAARLSQAYAKLYRFDCGVMSLAEFIKRNPPEVKRVSVQTHARREVCLNKPALAQKKYRYHIIVAGSWYEVPKIVYDDLDTPEGKEIAEG